MITHPPAQTASPLPTWALFRLWLVIGLQSVGAGMATLALIRKAFVEDRDLITPDNFSRDWALVKLAPGINIFAVTILIGRRVRGALGIAVSLAALLVPSIAATIVLTAFYAHIANVSWVRASLRGIGHTATCATTPSQSRLCED
jgi:chromate transporter